jgi:hypothetical protein
MIEGVVAAGRPSDAAGGAALLKKSAVPGVCLFNDEHRLGSVVREEKP